MRARRSALWQTLLPSVYQAKRRPSALASALSAVKLRQRGRFARAAVLHCPRQRHWRRVFSCHSLVQMSGYVPQRIVSQVYLGSRADLETNVNPFKLWCHGVFLLRLVLSLSLMHKSP